MIPSSEDDYLMLSGLQHFSFCRRQWALIHIEQQWAENLLTVEGNIMHEKAHSVMPVEKRKGTLIIRSMPVKSALLGLTGVCDVVEFKREEEGITLKKHRGKFSVTPIEYKRGRPKESDADRLQLCAQAMCLEEMLCCNIENGALFYGETKRRDVVEFTDLLRQTVKKMAEEMHEMYQRGYTPKVKTGKFCSSCSLKDICLPVLMKTKSAKEYIAETLEKQYEKTT